MTARSCSAKKQTRSACCAARREAAHATTVLPSSVMNSRRFIIRVNLQIVFFLRARIISSWLARGGDHLSLEVNYVDRLFGQGWLLATLG